MFDIIIRNGLVFDGNPRSRGLRTDVGIKGNIIAAVKDLPGESAETVIDATDLYVAPGFIDIQNHSDSHGQILSEPALESLVLQGITTIAIGQCGASLAPLPKPEALKSLQKWGVMEGLNADWRTFAEFVSKMKKHLFGTNVISFIGHATLRRSMVGDDGRILQAGEIRQLAQLLDSSLKEGAAGVSFGFQYGHEVSTTSEEIFALLNVVKNRDKVFSVHLRSQSENFLTSVQEVIDYTRTAGVKTKISHFKIEGSGNYGQLEPAINAVEQSYQSGARTHFDIYPYATSWRPLYVYLPSWAYEGGFKPMLERMRDKKTRDKIRQELQEHRVRIAHLLVSSSPRVTSFVDKSINQIAATSNVAVEEALLRVLSANNGQVIVFDRDISGEQITTLLKHPFSFIATDGVGYPMKPVGAIELPHPRCFGSMPRFLRLIRGGDNQPVLMSWGQGLSKITSMPAEFLGLKDRGVIAKGMVGDVVIFDPKTVADTATYTNPYRPPVGVRYVVNNGKISVFDSQLTGIYAGRMLTV